MFFNLIVNFYSLKTKKIPAGRSALGAIGCLPAWASLPNWESGCLLGAFGNITKGLRMLARGFWQHYKGAQSASEVTLVLNSASGALLQGLESVALGGTQQYSLSVGHTLVSSQKRWPIHASSFQQNCLKGQASLEAQAREDSGPHQSPPAGSSLLHERPVTRSYHGESGVRGDERQ